MNLLPNPGAEIDSVAQWQAYTGPGSGAVNSITKAYEGARSFLVTVDESDVVSVIGWYPASPPRSGLGSPETFTAGFSVQRTAPAQGITLTSGWQFVTSSITTEPGDVVDRADITFDVIDAMPTVSFHVDHGYIRDATTTQAERVARIRLGQFQLRPIGA
jgi:hypothetical protein